MTSYNKSDRKLIILAVSHLASGLFNYVGNKEKKDKMSIHYCFSS